jgi:predicted metal-binding protein
MLLVCRTCPRDRRDTGSFGDAVRAVTRAPAADDEAPTKALYVNCLGACDLPGNVALDGIGKSRVRFSGLATEQVADLRTACAAYDASPTGDPGEWDVPADLRPAISGVAPKRGPRSSARP